MSDNDPDEISMTHVDARPAPAVDKMDPDWRADKATKTILLELLDVIEEQQTGVLQNEDPECLHDFRIAVRRSRSILGQLKGVFPAPVAKRFAPRLAWLGKLTSDTRDFDVYLQGFDELKAELPEPFRDNIEPLRGFLEQHAALAHAEMSRQIQSRRYRQLLAGWRKYLSTPCPRRPTAPKALHSIKDIADRRIWKLFRRAVKQGKAIDRASPAEEIHELRKTCKKLRYLMEIFRSLYPADEINRPIKQLKKLQNYLGDFQDVHARIGMLQALSVDMRDSASTPTEALLSMGVLLASLERRQLALRRQFDEHFAPFVRSESRAHCRELFKPAGDTEEAGRVAAKAQ